MHYWVWNSFNVPKHSFIAWLVALDKLRTRGRLAHVGIGIDEQCVMCGHGQESCHHLFFRCCFSREVCVGVLLWLDIRAATTKCIFICWEKWERKFKSKRKQKVCYAKLAYYVSCVVS